MGGDEGRSGRGGSIVEVEASKRAIADALRRSFAFFRAMVHSSGGPGYGEKRAEPSALSPAAPESGVSRTTLHSSEGSDPREANTTRMV